MNQKQLEAKLWSKVVKAINRFNMIADSDRVILGVSGGKDSLTMLHILYLLKKYKKLNIEIIVGHMISDINPGNIDSPQTIQNICKKLGIIYDSETVSLTDKKYNKKNKVDCYWCSYQRRRIMFKLAEKHQCNKIAFAHHTDDIVITNFMNLFYLSNILTMRVNHSFFNGQFHIIRPLCLVREKEIIEYAKLMNFPSKPCNCKISKNGRREKLAEILYNLEKQIPEIVNSVFWGFAKNNEKISSIPDKFKTI